METKLFSDSLAQYQGEMPSTIQEAIDAIIDFTGSQNLKILKWDDLRLAVTIALHVELPPRGNFNNIDIRAEEPMLLVFRVNEYPRIAPRCYPDRLDFPTHQLPHLYIAKNGKPNPLCLVRGDLDEWYAEKEIKDLMLQTQAWLSDAASGALVEDGGRFDPIRLEGYTGTVIYPHDRLATVVNQNKSFVEGMNFSLALFSEERIQSSTTCPSWKLIKVLTDTNEFLESFKELITQLTKKNTQWTSQSFSVGLIVWDSNLTNVSDYFVRLPTNYQELLEFGHRINIDFSIAVDWFTANLFSTGTIHVPILAAIKRPKILIGYNSDIEFINFSITITDDVVNNSKIAKNISVAFHAHNEPFTTEKARQLSGYQNELGKVLVFGAGALGSKVVMHLARSGHTNLTIADSDTLSPHNLARHALSPVYLGKPKSDSLKHAITELFTHNRLDTLKSFVFDAEYLCIGNGPEGQLDYNWLLDFTASKSLLNFMARETLPPNLNICRASIMDEGNLGVLFIEGSKRNPRMDDLVILFYDLYKAEPIIAEWLQTELEKSKNERSMVNVGVGCNSETTLLSDELVSLHAASFVSAIKTESQQSSRQQNGFIFINMIRHRQTFTIQSKSFVIDPVMIWKSDAWEIRVRKGISEQLISKMQTAYPFETGGVFVGVINKKTKCIHITDVIFAPPDSTANEVCFFRGVEGLPEQIDKIKRESANTFGYVGEWHSHPKGPNALSPIDLNTAKKFADEFSKLRNPMPVFLSIVTPEGIFPFVFD